MEIFDYAKEVINREKISCLLGFKIHDCGFFSHRVFSARVFLQSANMLGNIKYINFFFKVTDGNGEKLQV